MGNGHTFDDVIVEVDNDGAVGDNQLDHVLDILGVEPGGVGGQI